MLRRKTKIEPFLARHFRICALVWGMAGWTLAAVHADAAWEDDWAQAGAEIPEEPGTVFRAESPAEIRSIMRDEAEPGDVVLMAEGVWRDEQVVFEGIGEPDRPIMLRAETPGEVVLTGSSRLFIGGEHLVVEGLLFKDGYLEGGAVVDFRTSNFGEAKHCRLTDSAIVDYNPPDRYTRYSWVVLRGHYNRVDHNRFEGQNHAGRMITAPIDEQPNYHRIDNNHFGQRTARSDDLRASGGAIIMIGNSFTSMYDSRSLVEHNLFLACSGFGEIISNKANENTFRYNTFIRSRGALTLRHGNRNLVEGNYFFGASAPGTGGVRVINADQTVINNYFHGLTGRGFTPPLGIMNANEDPELHEYSQVTDALIAFNTFVDCERPVIIGLGAERAELVLPPKNLILANNIFTATEGPIFEMRDSPDGMTLEGNIAWGADVGIPSQPGLDETDPELFRDPSGQWRPSGDSPALEGAEGDYPDILEDVDGRSRGETKDIGAHEFSGGDPARRPLTPSDVGPDWIRTSWERWRDAVFTADDLASGNAERLATPAGDDMTNLMKYALDMTSSGSRDRGHLPRVRTEDGETILRYLRRTGTDDVGFRVEASFDLVEWSDAEPAVENVEPIQDSSREEVRLHFPESTARFFRLVVTDTELMLDPVLFVDDFEGQALDQAPGAPWTSVSVTANGVIAVREDVDEIFGNGPDNRYLEYRDVDEGAMGLRAFETFSGPAASEIVTISFRFMEPDDPAHNDSLRLVPMSQGTRAQVPELGNGSIRGATYPLDEVHQVDFVFNNHADETETVTYDTPDGGERTLEGGHFDVWRNGNLVRESRQRAHDQAGPIDGFWFQSTSADGPLILFDDFVVRNYPHVTVPAE